MNPPIKLNATIETIVLRIIVTINATDTVADDITGIAITAIIARGNTIIIPFLISTEYLFHVMIH